MKAEIGATFRFLTVIEAHARPRRWIARCVCRKLVECTTYQLESGARRSCGCRRDERAPRVRAIFLPAVPRCTRHERMLRLLEAEPLLTAAELGARTPRAPLKEKTVVHALDELRRRRLVSKYDDERFMLAPRGIAWLEGAERARELAMKRRELQVKYVRAVIDEMWGRYAAEEIAFQLGISRLRVFQLFGYEERKEREGEERRREAKRTMGEHEARRDASDDARRDRSAQGGARPAA